MKIRIGSIVKHPWEELYAIYLGEGYWCIESGKIIMDTKFLSMIESGTTKVRFL